MIKIFKTSKKDIEEDIKECFVKVILSLTFCESTAGFHLGASLKLE